MKIETEDHTNREIEKKCDFFKNCYQQDVWLEIVKLRECSQRAHFYQSGASYLKNPTESSSK